jgi:hypothetical protein
MYYMDKINMTIYYTKARCFLSKEEFEDTKGVIIIRISKKNRQHNGQNKSTKSDLLCHEGTALICKKTLWFYQILTWLTFMEYLCHKLPRICSTCRKHLPVRSSFMIYHRVYKALIWLKPITVHIRSMELSVVMFLIAQEVIAVHVRSI